MVIAVFWLSASAAWANGVSVIYIVYIEQRSIKNQIFVSLFKVINMKYAVNPENWLYNMQESICYQNPTTKSYEVDGIVCTLGDSGNFKKANVSIVRTT